MAGVDMMTMNRMTEDEFVEFMEISIKDHIQSQIRAGNWTEENAQGNMNQLRLEMIPDNMATPDHYFYTLKEDVSGKPAGGLWFTVQSNEQERFIFVVDIQVFVGFRRRGYGSQAFRFVEDKAVEMGIKTIYLNVFEHNVNARRMYEKLGYSGETELMIKRLP